MYPLPLFVMFSLFFSLYWGFVPVIVLLRTQFPHGLDSSGFFVLRWPANFVAYFACTFVVGELFIMLPFNLVIKKHLRERGITISPSFSNLGAVENFESGGVAAQAPDTAVVHGADRFASTAINSDDGGKNGRRTSSVDSNDQDGGGAEESEKEDTLFVRNGQIKMRKVRAYYLLLLVSASFTAMLVDMSWTIGKSNSSAFNKEARAKFEVPYGNGPHQARPTIRSLVRNEIVPELAEYYVGVETVISNNGYFLSSSPSPATLAVGAPMRIYDVNVNPQLFNESFGPEGKDNFTLAMPAILTHELCHSVDYISMNLFEFATWAAAYQVNYNYLIAYEHATDVCVLLRDEKHRFKYQLGIGLMQYRVWVYAAVEHSPEQLAAKKREYMTPKQISLWLKHHNAPSHAIPHAH